MRKINDQKASETNSDHNNIPIYFNSNGNTPIDIAELNISFYQNFVQEFGSSAAYRHLWPGESLLSMIQCMKRQCRNIKDRANRKRAAKLIKQYKSLYRTLINQ